MSLLQKLRKNRTILSICISLGMFLLAVVPFGQALASPSVTINSPGSNTYFLVGSTVHIEAYVSGNPTSVTAQYLTRAAYNNNYFVETSLGTLTREGTSNYYQMYYTVSTPPYTRLASFAPNLSVMTPQVQVTATDGTGTTKVSNNCTFCYTNQTSYSSMDSTFFYYSEYANPFGGCFTGQGGNPVALGWTYNCMAYALGLVPGGWLWPTGWGIQPSYPQVSSVMSGTYGYTQCSQTAFSGAQVIYYSGGHFSRVNVWDINGMPSQIMSKWGGWELLSSLSATPFTGKQYGSAIGYFKK